MDLDDIENLCKKVIIIDQGRIIRQDLLANLKAEFANEKTLAIEIAPCQILQVPSGCNLIKSEGNIHYISYTQQKTSEVIQAMLNTHEVHDIAFVPVDISEIIKNAYVSK